MYLENNWDPIIEKDIDGPQALPGRIDNGNPDRFGRYSAARRVARSIYLGSAPHQRAAHKGLTEASIILGCSQPGEPLSIFGDALRRLSDQSSFLYLDGQRYWYGTHPTVTRLAQERAEQYSDDDVYVELEKRLRAEQSTRGDFARVHACPPGSGDVTDDDTAVRLVILPPSVSHARADRQSSAWLQAEHILEKRGNSPRNNKNTLIFLAADRLRLDDLKAAGRQYLAWHSICQEGEKWNLDTYGRNLAQTKRDDADNTVKMRIAETYSWLLIPVQEKLKPLTLEDQRLQPQSQPPSPLALVASRKLKMEELLISQYWPTHLRGQLDEVPLWRGNHLPVKTLCDYFAHHVYLPRLQNSQVLLDSIKAGVQSSDWERDTFAYAEDWDEDQQRYKGLKTGESIALNSPIGLLVKPEAARAQRDAEEAERRRKQEERAAYEASLQPTQPALRENGATLQQTPLPVQPTPSNPNGARPPRERQKRRFHGSIKINPRVMGGDASKIMLEVVQHLTSLSKDGVTVTLEIQAHIPDGIPNEIQQVVQENCNTLRFENANFEDE